MRRGHDKHIERFLFGGCGVHRTYRGCHRIAADVIPPFDFEKSTPDVVAVAGDSDWVEKAITAIEGGAMGVLVVDPTATESVDRLRTLSSDRNVPVVIDRPIAGNPGVVNAAPRFAEFFTPDSLLESHHVIAPGSDRHRTLLDQLGVVATAAAPVGSATNLVWAPDGYIVRGVLSSGQRVLISAVVTAAQPPSGWLRQLGAAAAVELTIPGWLSARPALLTVTTAEGASLAPTIYETSHRASWRRLHHHIRNREPGQDLDRFDHDNSVLRATVR